METIEATRLSDFITLPNAEEGFVKAVTTTADTLGVDLRKIGNQSIDLSSSQATKIGMPEHFITIQADGADVWIVTGVAQSDVTAGNVPNSTAVGTGIRGTPAVGICFKVPKDQERSFLVTSDRPWLGFVGGAAGYIRVFKTSR